MKKLDVTSNLVREMIEEFNAKMKAPKSLWDITPQDVLMDHDLCKMFEITPRSLYNYRKQNRISYYKLGNQFYYYKPFLVMNIIDYMIETRQIRL